MCSNLCQDWAINEWPKTTEGSCSMSHTAVNAKKRSFGRHIEMICNETENYHRATTTPSVRKFWASVSELRVVVECSDLVSIGLPFQWHSVPSSTEIFDKHCGQKGVNNEHPSCSCAFRNIRLRGNDRAQFWRFVCEKKKTLFIQCAVISSLFFALLLVQTGENAFWRTSQAVVFSRRMQKRRAESRWCATRNQAFTSFIYTKTTKGNHSTNSFSCQSRLFVQINRKVSSDADRT